MTALTYVSAASGSADSTGTTVATAAWNLTSGHHVFVYVKWNPTDTAITLSDTAGNAYTALARTFNTTSGYPVGGQWFYCLNAVSNATNTVTATFAASRNAKNVRALVFSGTAPPSITQYAALSDIGGGVSIADRGTDIGVGSVMLAGESSYNADTTRTFSIAGAACTEVGTAYTTASTAYREFASGWSSSTAVDFTGTAPNTARVLLVLQVDSGVSSSSLRTTSDVSKLGGYATLGSVPDSASASSINAYALLGSVPDTATVSSVNAYAVTHEIVISVTKTDAYAVLGASNTDATNSKTLAYAVLGGSSDGVSTTKTTAYAVLGAGDVFQSVGKITSYAVLEVSISTARPQVFVCT